MGFHVGELVDVLDKHDDLWSPALVTSVHKDHRYGVKYVGWGEEFNEVVSMSSGRLITGGTYVSRVKCWAKISPQLCWWPCLVYIRKPAGDLGVNNLREEKKLFVKPFGPNTYPIKTYIEGIWRNSSYISPWGSRFENRYLAGLSESKIARVFQKAVDEAKASDAFDIIFKFDGSYEYSGMKLNPPGKKKTETSLETVSVVKETGMEPTVLAIQSKSHIIQAIRHQFHEGTRFCRKFDLFYAKSRPLGDQGDAS